MLSTNPLETTPTPTTRPEAIKLRYPWVQNSFLLSEESRDLSIIAHIEQTTECANKVESKIQNGEYSSLPLWEAYQEIQKDYIGEDLASQVTSFYDPVIRNDQDHIITLDEWANSEEASTAIAQVTGQERQGNFERSSELSSGVVRSRRKEEIRLMGCPAEIVPKVRQRAFDNAE